MIKLIINNFSVSFQQARLKNNHTFKKLDLSLWKITLFLIFLRRILCVKNYDKICHNNNHKNHLLEIQFDVSGIHSSVLPLHAPAKYYRESASAGIRRGCIQVTIQLTTDHSETLNPLYIVYSHFRLLQNMIESASAGIRRCCVQITIRLTTDHSEKYNPLQRTPPSRSC